MSWFYTLWVCVRATSTAQAESLEYYIQEDQSLVPIRWMPPEAFFEKKYSVKSDVWSFGVTLWEIFNLAILPYKDFNKTQAELIKQVKDKGLRLQKPIYPLNPAINSELFELMKLCWDGDKRKRPKYSEIASRLSSMKSTLEKIDVDSRIRNTSYKPNSWFYSDNTFTNDIISQK